MNASVSKYAPKTKTYGMTISLTKRIIMAYCISNLTAEQYWGQVYSSLGLTMSIETTSFLKSQDTYRFYKKMYHVKTDIKVRERNIITIT